MARRSVLKAFGALGAAGCVVSPASSIAQAAKRSRRIGVLFWGPEDAAATYLRPGLAAGLAESGLAEGVNVAVEWRFSNGDAARDARLIAELVASGNELLVTAGNERVTSILSASPATPVVAIALRPVEMGFAQTLAKPGGRVTGLASEGSATTAKQIEVMRTIYPRGKFLAILIGTEDRDPRIRAAGFEQGARDAGIEHETRVVRGLEGFEAAFRRLRSRSGVAYVASFAPSVSPRAIAEAAIANRVPTMTIHRYYVDHGGLLGYWPSPHEVGRRLGSIAAMVLRGTPPGDIPIEFITRHDLVINLRTAAALGIEIPPALRLQASELISG